MEDAAGMHLIKLWLVDHSDKVLAASDFPQLEAYVSRSWYLKRLLRDSEGTVPELLL